MYNESSHSNMIDALLSQEEYGEIRKITEYIHGVTDENKVIRYCDNLIIHRIGENCQKRKTTIKKYGNQA